MTAAKKKWAQPPWTPERRAIHRAACREAAERTAAAKLKELIEGAAFIRENEETIEMLFKLKQRYGIEPRELMKFILLIPKDKLPLSEDQASQWRELAIQKIPAAEIYQRMFGGAA